HPPCDRLRPHPARSRLARRRCPRTRSRPNPRHGPDLRGPQPAALLRFRRCLHLCRVWRRWQTGLRDDGIAAMKIAPILLALVALAGPANAEECVRSVERILDGSREISLRPQAYRALLTV